LAPFQRVKNFYTTDPGKALITGKCSDFNRLKGPILRGLRPAVILRFDMKLTDQEKAELL